MPQVPQTPVFTAPSSGFVRYFAIAQSLHRLSVLKLPLVNVYGLSLNIEKQIAEQTVLKLEGRLDTATAPELEKCIEESLDQINELVFDFTDLEYISSAGLRVILKAQKIMNGKGGMKVINVNESIMDVFEITGFADFLTIE